MSRITIRRRWPGGGDRWGMEHLDRQGRESRRSRVSSVASSTTNRPVGPMARASAKRGSDSSSDITEELPGTETGYHLQPTGVVPRDLDRAVRHDEHGPGRVTLVEDVLTVGEHELRARSQCRFPCGAWRTDPSSPPAASTRVPGQSWRWSRASASATALFIVAPLGAPRARIPESVGVTLGLSAAEVDYDELGGD